MKKFLVLGLFLFLTGCSNIVFDGTNYNNFVSLYEAGVKLEKQCDNPEVIRKGLLTFKEQADHIGLYSKFRSGGPEVASAAKTISEMIDEIVTRYDGKEPSVTYCKEKFNNITSGTLTVVSTLGAQQ